MTDHNENDYDYRRIALAFKLSTLSILLYVPTVIAAIGVGIYARNADISMNDMSFISFTFLSVGVFALVAFIFSIWCVQHLAKLLHYEGGTILLFVICIFLSPILALIPLICVYCRAGNILQQTDKSLTTVRLLPGVSDEVLGLILGLALTVIVFGFFFLFFYAR